MSNYSLVWYDPWSKNEFVHLCKDCKNNNKNKNSRLQANLKSLYCLALYRNHLLTDFCSRQNGKKSLLSSKYLDFKQSLEKGTEHLPAVRFGTGGANLWLYPKWDNQELGDQAGALPGDWDARIRRILWLLSRGLKAKEKSKIFHKFRKHLLNRVKFPLILV